MLSLDASSAGWQNWSGDVVFRPSQRLTPATESEVQQIVDQCRHNDRRLRVTGSGHSFTPLVATEDVLMSLERLQGLVSVDNASHQVSVMAGTTLRQLGQWLFEQGYAQENLGDIDAQTVAGAISTGTHGSGLAFGSLSTQVTGLRIVTGTGEVVQCDADTAPEIFHAARVALGCFGVITQVTLRVLPAYKLHYRSRRETLSNCLAKLPEYQREHRNFEFYWFPHSDRVQLKFMDETTEPDRGGGLAKQARDLLLENALFGLVSRLCRGFPASCRAISRLCARLVSSSERIGDAHRVYATRRLVRFHEMEYSIPLEHFDKVIDAIRTATSSHRFAVHFPLECRFVKGDDIPLSPSAGRDSAYIAVHMYQGMPYQSYFRHLEKILLAHGGRPHWGKWHSCTAEHLAPRYPEWARFQKLRRELDPEGVFMTPYMQSILGEG